MKVFIHADHQLLAKIDWAQKQLGIHLAVLSDAIEEICKQAVAYQRRYNSLLSLFQSTIQQVCQTFPKKHEMNDNLKFLAQELKGYEEKEKLKTN